MSSLFGSNKFNADHDIPDLSGKVYVVTGGSAGIGFGITAHLLQHNASKVIILSNKEEHARTALEELKEYGDASKAEWKQCNLQDLKATDNVARELAQSLQRLDGLILNAGVGVGVYAETVDGLDSHFQVNHLSQFHLLLTLLPLLQRTPNSRLVLESSELHRGPTDEVQFASLAEINRDIGPMKLYNRSKLAQVLTVRALQRRQDARQLDFSADVGRVYINAVHPGAVGTDQPKQAEEAYGKAGALGHTLLKLFLQEPVSSGCRSALFAATAKRVEEEGISGCYIVPDAKVTEPSDRAKDEMLGERLLDLSERLLRERLG